MSDWHQDLLQRTNEDAAVMLLREQEEQRRKEERPRKELEDENKRRERQCSSSANSNESCSADGGSNSSDAAAVPWSSLNWFEKLLSIPGIIFNSIPLLAIRIPCFLFVLGVLETFVRGVFFSDGAPLTPESLITCQIITCFFHYLKIVYDIVAPAPKQFLESVYQFMLSFLAG